MSMNGVKTGMVRMRVVRMLTPQERLQAIIVYCAVEVGIIMHGVVACLTDALAHLQ